MDINLQKKIFEALIEFEKKGDIFEEKEIVILGCMSNGSTTETKKKLLNTIELQKMFPEYTLEEINENTINLAEKDFIKINRISSSTINYIEIINSLASLDEFLDEF